MEQKHTIDPFYNHDSKILILGSFPSVKSRESGFFYGHPQNRFWKVLAAVFAEPVPVSVDEKKTLLSSHRIALFDVIASCDISGSSDSSIKNVIPNDIGIITSACDIRQIFVNGKTAEKLYIRYIRPISGRDAVCMPSTSPANASYSLDMLIEHWKIINV